MQPDPIASIIPVEPVDTPQARTWRRHVNRTAWLLLAGGAGSMGLVGANEGQRQIARTALQTEMLKAHNNARREVGMPPMVWSRQLEANAAAYAGAMARTRRFAHSRNRAGAPPQGENLWMGTRGAYSYADMAGAWVEEQQFYDGGSIDDAFASGTFGNVGHYTQIIWRRTTHVGCAVSTDGTDDYLVCRYMPAGNVHGRSPGSEADD
jgi:uncharacterized protein YkwD